MPCGRVMGDVGSPCCVVYITGHAYGPIHAGICLMRTSVVVESSFGSRMRSLSPRLIIPLHFRCRGQNFAGQNFVRGPQQFLPEQPSLSLNAVRWAFRACLRAELYSANAPHGHKNMKRCRCFMFSFALFALSCALLVVCGWHSLVWARLYVQRSRSVVEDRIRDTFVRPRRMSTMHTQCTSHVGSKYLIVLGVRVCARGGRWLAFALRVRL